MRLTHPLSASGTKIVQFVNIGVSQASCKTSAHFVVSEYQIQQVWVISSLLQKDVAGETNTPLFFSMSYAITQSCGGGGRGVVGEVRVGEPGKFSHLIDHISPHGPLPRHAVSTAGPIHEYH